MRLRRIDHVGIVVSDLAAHVEHLKAMGLALGRTNDSGESHAEYFACGDASVELIDVRDPQARSRRLPEGEPARIEHIAFEAESSLEEVRDELRARGIAVSWPPFPSGGWEMIWTEAETSGGVQYQFMRRPERGG